MNMIIQTKTNHSRLQEAVSKAGNLSTKGWETRPPLKKTFIESKMTLLSLTFS